MIFSQGLALPSTKTYFTFPYINEPVLVDAPLDFTFANAGKVQIGIHLLICPCQDCGVRLYFHQFGNDISIQQDHA